MLYSRQNGASTKPSSARNRWTPTEVANKASRCIGCSLEKQVGEDIKSLGKRCFAWSLKKTIWCLCRRRGLPLEVVTDNNASSSKSETEPTSS